MTDIRVTKAGRQAVTQEDADVRVTKAGRQAVTQDTIDLRVTQLGRYVLMVEPRPTRPLLISPAEDATVSETMGILHTQSEDPLGGAVTYTFRYRKVGDTVWTTAFTGRSELDAFYEDVSELDDDDYECELWASTIGYDSSKTKSTFIIHNGRPTAPIITAPFWGQEWQQESNDVEWEPSSDPQGDPVTYHARYRAIGAGSWNTLFDDEDSPYAWNMAAIAVDDYEMEVWANDGIGDSDHSYVQFSVGILDRPSIPRIRILSYTESTLEIELEEYAHPQDRPWQATNYEVIPWGGDWTNRTFNITTTDPDEALYYLFEGMSQGFHGVVRARHQDDNDTWGPWSEEVEFHLPGATNLWHRRWDRTGGWRAGGAGAVVSYHPDPGPWSGFCPPAQHPDAIVVYESDELGSFIMQARVSIAGCNCGWIGRDTELRDAGIGIFAGNADLDNEIGVFASFGSWVSNAAASGVPGSVSGSFKVGAIWDDHTWSSGYPTSFGTIVVPLGGYYNAWGVPIGRWEHPKIPKPVYTITLWVQRDLAGPSTRIRAKADAFGSDQGLMAPVAEGEWHIDQTINELTPCGQPGYWMAQYICRFAPPAENFFSSLQVTPLRDLNQDFVQNVDPLTPYVPPAPGVCTPVSEDALADPVLFPGPPNGDVEEELGFPTDVLAARDDTEQRVSLHDRDVTKVAWRVTLPTSREINYLKNLIFDQQADRWGVPMWMNAAPLTADLGSGAGSIPNTSVDVEGRRFNEVEYVVIWADLFTWDFLPAELQADGSIDLTGTTSRAYSANETYVIPVRIGRMPRRLDWPRSAPYIADLPIEFVLEAIDG